MEQEFKLSDCPVEVLQDEKEFAEFMEFYKQLAPKKVLEIGSFYGGTLWHFLKYSKLETLTCIDMQIPPADERYSQMVVSRIKWPSWVGTYMPNGRFNDIPGNSQWESVISTAKNLHPENDIDLLHIDGDHSYQGVKADYENYKGMVRPGGVIVFHDIFGIEDVNRLWEEVKRNYPKTRQITQPGG